MKTFGRRTEAALRAVPLPPPEAEAPPPAPHAPAAKPAETPAPLQALRTQVMERIDPRAAVEMPQARVREQLERLVHEVAGAQRIEISATDQALLAQELVDDMLGFGPIEELLRDDGISDIMINGPENIFIEKRGKLQQVKLNFRSASHVASIAQKMAATVGRRVDESSPLVDCRLPDGSRVNVVFPPLALDGPCISIRKFSKRKVDLQGMVELGSLSNPIARVLEIASRCRLNIVVSGGTGSGKTTMMNAMSRMIDHGERIVTIEDAAELQLQQPHVVRLETRPMNLEGRGEITQRDLIKNALRMRPDRIIVGEVRGAEAFDMLQAMNTGHDGSFCTIHANNARDGITRIENMVQMGTVSLPLRAIRTQIVSAVDVIVQLERMRDGKRRVQQVTEVCGLEGDVITLNDLFTYEFESEDAQGNLIGRWVSSRVRPGFMNKLRYFGLDSAFAQAMEIVA
ncbi:CpaF family protein [Roseomonas sp. AR75]|uniref:CpaF family protein n=1 Tax=Roseomonas sp. AR75 TaxID=2562311 RepID=UPI0010C149D0|nr:CpaF family protein [Roseomonas sp. AR75]